MKKRGIIAFCMLFVLCVFFVDRVEAASSQIIIVNKTNHKLAFYENGKLIRIFSVATGMRDSYTPEGIFDVSVKWSCPTYYKLNIKGCDKRNPLGPRWIGLSVPKTSGYIYGIHGNSDGSSIGRSTSSGCVRMYNEEVKWLFERVRLHTKVVIVKSSSSFDTLARNYGYLPKKQEVQKAVLKKATSVLPIKTINLDVTLLSRVALYDQPNSLLKPSAYTNGSFLRLTKEQGEWYGVLINGKTKWLLKKEVVEGKRELGPFVLTLSGSSTLYHQPFVTSISSAKLSNQAVKATQRIGNWFEVKTWMGNKWVYVEKPMIGEKKVFQKRIFLEEKANFYSEPFYIGKRISYLNSQFLVTQQKWGNWYEVKTWLGPKWIEIKEVIVVNEQELELKETTPIYAIRKTTSKPLAMLSAQKIKSTGYAEGTNWYQVQTWLGVKWIYIK